MFLEPLRLLEAGEEWMPDESMEVVEETLGWWVGATSDIRHNYDYADIPLVKLPLVKAWSLPEEHDPWNTPGVPASPRWESWGEPFTEPGPDSK